MIISSTVADVPSPWIVLEYMEHGDLKTFLTVSTCIYTFVRNPSSVWTPVVSLTMYSIRKTSDPFNNWSSTWLTWRWGCTTYQREASYTE